MEILIYYEDLGIIESYIESTNDKAVIHINQRLSPKEKQLNYWKCLSHRFETHKIFTRKGKC